MSEKNLNIRQLKFIEELLKGKTQKEAYINAGYEVKDDNTAEAAASRLLRNVNIQAEIEKRLTDIKYRNNLRLYRISEVALANLVNILQSDDEIEITKGAKKFSKNNYLIRIKADLIRDILDRVGLKLAEEYNLNFEGKIESSLSDLTEEAIINLVNLARESIAGLSSGDKEENK